MSYFTLFLAIGFVVAGIANIARYRRLIPVARSSVNWPRVRGTIVTSRLDAFDNDWLPIIEYKYQFAEQSYSGNSIVIGDPDASLSKRAKEITNRYQVGDAVDVAVDPSDPANSTLEPGIQGFLYINAAISMFFLVLGLVLLVLVGSH